MKAYNKTEKAKLARHTYHQRTKDDPKRIIQRKLANTRHRLRQQRLINYFKNKPCADCNMFYPSYVMQFDHRNPMDKVFTIANEMGRSRKRLIEEIKKCDVVCANCHMERTHKRRKDVWN